MRWEKNHYVSRGKTVLLEHWGNAILNEVTRTHHNRRITSKHLKSLKMIVKLAPNDLAELESFFFVEFFARTFFRKVLISIDISWLHEYLSVYL